MSHISKELSQLRQDYQKNVLDEHEVGDNPVSFFEKWFAQVLDAGEEEPNAMTLATVSPEGKPKARIVLLKGIENGKFLFYTNYLSQKGKDLAAHSSAAIVFFWKSLERQVRIEGSVVKVEKAISEAYFRSRPKNSQLGAIASPQSQVVESRAWLEKHYGLIEHTYQSKDIDMPGHWGGYALTPLRMEFWQGRTSRLHDRIVFERKEENQDWQKSRLAP